MAEKRADGRVITGGPTDVKGKVTLSSGDKKELKDQMYQDFLTAKQTGKIQIEYKFDSWLRDSVQVLRGPRKTELDMQFQLGTLAESEHKALNELRENMISMIISMDVSGLDQYGLNYITPTTTEMVNSQTGERLLIPTHRKGVVKIPREIIK